jgi:hypothetical protein
LDRKIFIIILVLGIAATLAGFYLIYDTAGLLNRSLKATAIVTELKYNNDGLAYPVLQFSNYQGSIVTTRLNEAQKPPAYAVGDRVEIIYDLNSPSNVRVNSLFGIWLAPMLMTILGVIFLSTGFMHYWGSRQWA